MKIWTKIFLLTVLPLFALTSCDDDDELQPDANVMVVHASPDAPAVDLLIDDTKVNTTALTYPNNTGYLNVNPGTRNVKVNAAGTSTTVINGNLDLESGRSYSVFAINTLANIEPLILEDDLTSPASGRAHVRFLHLSPDAPAVDIAVQNGPVIFGNRAFKSATAFTPVDAGTYTLEVRLAGSSTVVLTVPNVVLENGAILTVFAQGFVNPPAGNTNSLGAGAIRNN
ncbi:DUF4397 domain-containing protein [Pontibacter qinzhouensis]|uniref:DUF4397 domain-containing protein n=1 Tax=Pontibacter qinzhouensis TaxID=2603253 RepID=A0A5C8IJ42_9BACT|nr:DUF4397 domain-containing protein [Pontibacter qinzhouensis]TXK21141.1 DUF4397 domain-containing protein [Pontibacter qinzhouensis]